jgi:ABC-2 type transport system permease protein
VSDRTDLERESIGRAAATPAGAGRDADRDLPRLSTVLTSQLRYQIRLVARTPRALVSAMLLPILVLFALKLSSETSQDTSRYLVAGAVVFGTISISYVTFAIGLVTARESGALKRLRGTAMPRWVYLASRVTATVLIALVCAAVALATAVDLVHVSLPLSRMPLVAAAVVVGAVCWASLGTAISGLLPSPEAAWPALSATYLPVLFISGVFFAPGDEPHWVYELSRWLPAQPFSTLVQAAMWGTGTDVGQAVLVQVTWTAVGSVVGLWAFRWLPVTRRRVATRTAT